MERNIEGGYKAAEFRAPRQVVDTQASTIPSSERGDMLKAQQVIQRIPAQEMLRMMADAEYADRTYKANPYE